MAIVPLTLVFFLLGILPVWGLPLAAAIVAWAIYAPPPFSTLIVAAVAIGAAAPLSVGLAGAILDRVCRNGGLPTVVGGSPFRLLGLVLVGAVALHTDAPLDLLVTVRTLAEQGGGLDLLGVVSTVGKAICVCGGLVALVGIGAIVLVELPLRWCLSPYRVSPLDLSLGAARPFIVLGVAAALFHLGAALIAHETAPRVLGGMP